MNHRDMVSDVSGPYSQQRLTCNANRGQRPLTPNSRLARKFVFVSTVLCLFVAWQGFATQESTPGNRQLDLRSIPISDWLNGSDVAEIPWSIQLRPAVLGIDQRIEVFYNVSIRAKALNAAGKTHE